ncbi:MAG: S16 family serine protease [Candidatus Woesearchaeota archaeon]
MKKLLFVLITLLLLPSIFGAKSIKLLAVQEEDGQGNIATMELETRKGEGRVFLETFPLTKYDTQISTRFAKEIACNYLERDCSKLDFFYTVRSESGFVGGPSAGASTALLTIAVLENKDIPQDISMTGTINSGGSIGPVGGVKEKIEGGAKAGIKKIFIPKGERKIKIGENVSFDVVEYGKNLSVEVIEVAELQEALKEYGIPFKKKEYELIVDPDYNKVMKAISNQLCERTLKLKDAHDISENISKDITRDATNATRRAASAYKENKYYTAASYCFSTNAKINALILSEKNLSKKEAKKSIENIRKELESLVKELNKKKLLTLTDLQTYMIVTERISDTENSLNQTLERLEKNQSFANGIAYARERLESAKSWMQFFGVNGRKFELDKEHLRTSCLKKVEEAKERFQYVKTYAQQFDVGEKLQEAETYYNTGKYELCLFKASLIKADVNSVLSVLGVTEAQLGDIIDTKRNIAKRLIAEQGAKDNFPILGYSYYEYAGELKDSQPISALLYSEYSLELSNLDIYFKEKKNTETEEFSYEKVGILVFGMLLGAAIVLIFKKKQQL